MKTIAWVHRAAYRAMCRGAARWERKETGGVLLGYWASKSAVVITRAIGPGPRAEHGISRFVPDHEFHEQAIEREYTRSGRTIIYLGDWHTHPGGGASLSALDRKTLGAIARYAPARARSPLMGIVSGRAPWTLTLWRLRPLGRLIPRSERLPVNLFHGH